MNGKLEKYLRRSIRDARPLERFAGAKPPLEGTTTFAVVIPVFAELANLHETLESLLASFAACPETDLPRKSRILLVVNNPPPDTASVPGISAKIADNSRLLEKLRSSRMLNELPSFNTLEHPPALEWIDASSPGFEINPKHGVGMARRIGFDALLPMMDWSADPIFCSLDADTLVETDYVTEIADYFRGDPGIPGASLRIEHQRGGTPELERAIRRYENYLRSYVSGLRSAGSPYAYHFIGSAMAFRADAYVKAGGIPAKPAGEDFYLMQALRKTVPLPGERIGYIDSTAVHPSPRLSDRVAFGTGRRVEALIKSEKGDSDERLPGCRSYSPDDFKALRTVLDSARSVLITSGEQSFLSSLPASSADFFESRGFREVWPAIVKNTPQSPEKLEWGFHTWFDALRTLQFIHKQTS